MLIRLVDEKDITGLLKIYDQYIDTAITFEYTLPSYAVFKERVFEIKKSYPFLVCENEQGITGYAYAHRHMGRPAYRWNAVLSVYVDNAFTLKGIGTTLYNTLIDILKAQGIKTVYGGITVPNEKSENLHNKTGFHKIGVYHNAGYKCGKWHDVAWYEKHIAGHGGAPLPFIPINEIPISAVNEIIVRNMNNYGRI